MVSAVHVELKYVGREFLAARAACTLGVRSAPAWGMDAAWAKEPRARRRARVVCILNSTTVVKTVKKEKNEIKSS